MNAWQYDKSFEGLLSAVFDAYTRKAFPDRLLGEGEAPLLGVRLSHSVENKPEKAERVFAGLKRLLPEMAMNRLCLVWFSELPGSDELLFRYMRLIFDNRADMEGDCANPDVLAVRQVAKKVGHEAQLMLGFTRFQKTAQGVYFAPIAPKYNVLNLMLPHFTDRFSDQPWVLYDLKRSFGVYHAPGSRHCFHEVFFDASQVQNGRLADDLLADNERLFQELWKGYFAATAIKERANPRLQARCMPRRYWPYMTEKQETPAESIRAPAGRRF